MSSIKLSKPIDSGYFVKLSSDPLSGSLGNHAKLPFQITMIRNIRRKLFIFKLTHIKLINFGSGSYFLLFILLNQLSYIQADGHSIEARKGVPCVYEGHLKSSKNWYGFLANITIATSARIAFEFLSPADMCCQNILFYTEEQVSLISHKMNCWQKEYLLRPEEDQMLRLTPKFPWSGCHLVHHLGQPVYICEGGRSVISDKPNQQPKTWYIAVSHCETLHGLDLQFRLVVHGQVGLCQAHLFNLNPLNPLPFPLAKPQTQLLSQGNQNLPEGEDLLSRTCSYKGFLNTTEEWFGFILNTSIAKGGGFRFKFSYPFNMQVQRVIMYSDRELNLLREEYDCWQKEALIRGKHQSNRYLELSLQFSWNGCIYKNISSHHNNEDDSISGGGGGGGTGEMVCEGERRYNEMGNYYLAVSNCRSKVGIKLNYQVEVFGFFGNICNFGNKLIVLKVAWLQGLLLTMVLFN